MLELLMMCSPAVSPVTMAAVVKQESGGQPWVLNNNTTKKTITYTSKVAAVAAALAAVARGDSVDMGLAQISSKNLPALGLSVEQVFDPCTNLAAGARILAAGYKRAGSLIGALSAYNTGRSDSKLGATYVQRVFQHAGVKVPAIPDGQLARLPTLEEESAFAATPVTMPAVRLAITPSPMAAGLSPVKATFQPAGWR